LKLKMYTQVRLAQDVSAEVAKLISEDGLIGPGDDFQMQYGTSSAPENRNLGYAQEYAAGGAFNYISPYFFEIMKGDNTFFDENIYKDIEDPRIPYYFYNQLPDGATDADAENPCSYCPSRSGTPFLSIWMFSFNIDPNEGFDQSSSQTVMGLYPIGGRYDDGQGGAVNFNGAADTPQRLLTYYARKYLEAELAITGVTDGDARALLEEAIRASFDKVDEIAAAASAPALVEEDVEAYIAAVLERYDAADAEGKLEHIMTQKWIATYGFGVDAYTDYRRTG
ncbi:MAG: SusD/RagB family nutrient-binding outer membrane lipoprotein, partial [Phaeodactylibacter sp.]|nr:SusD/RagB family nutrient-binding outer membrane lipoprotein [Phaeodactylibacter sp.]